LAQVAHDPRLTKTMKMWSRELMWFWMFFGRGRCLQWAAKPAYKSDWKVLRHQGLLPWPSHKHARETLIPGLPAEDIQRESTMQVLYARCAGLDVHCKTVSVCVSVCETQARKRRQVKVFYTFTHDLLEMADWLKREGVTHVAMEATGVY
jgi:hypothetical protein